MTDVPDSLTTHRSIIDLWPSLSAFADDIGCKYGTAKQMRRRDSISHTRVPAVVEAAAKRGFVGVTAKLIADIVAQRTSADVAETLNPDSIGVST